MPRAGEFVMIRHARLAQKQIRSLAWSVLLPGVRVNRSTRYERIISNLSCIIESNEYGQYSDAKIYTQMVYLDKVFDIQKAMQEDKSDVGGGEINPSGIWKQWADKNIEHIKVACEPFRPALDELKASVQRFMSKNARMYVDLSTLFSFVSLKPAINSTGNALIVWNI